MFVMIKYRRNFQRNFIVLYKYTIIVQVKG